MVVVTSDYAGSVKKPVAKPEEDAPKKKSTKK